VVWIGKSDMFCSFLILILFQRYRQGSSDPAGASPANVERVETIRGNVVGALRYFGRSARLLVRGGTTKGERAICLILLDNACWRPRWRFFLVALAFEFSNPVKQ
jgi:hypothetical protein